MKICLFTLAKYQYQRLFNKILEYIFHMHYNNVIF